MSLTLLLELLFGGLLHKLNICNMKFPGNGALTTSLTCIWTFSIVLTVIYAVGYWKDRLALPWKDSP